MTPGSLNRNVICNKTFSVTKSLITKHVFHKSLNIVDFFFFVFAKSVFAWYIPLSLNAYISVWLNIWGGGKYFRKGKILISVSRNEMIILFIFNFLRPSQNNNRYYILNLSNSRKVIDVRAVKNGRKKNLYLPRVNLRFTRFTGILQNVYFVWYGLRFLLIWSKSPLHILPMKIIHTELVFWQSGTSYAN